MPDGAPLFGFTPRALPIRAAAYYVGLSPTTFRAEVATHIAPVRLSAGRIAWLREDLDRWLDSRRQPAEPTRPAPAPEPAHAARDPFAAALANLPPSRRARRQAQAG